MHNPKQLLKPSEIAPMLGVTNGRVYQLIAAGVIPHTTVGGAIRIPKDAWEKWLAEQSQTALASVRKESSDASEH